VAADVGDAIIQAVAITIMDIVIMYIPAMDAVAGSGNS
jgi:hypothetical protein